MTELVGLCSQLLTVVLRGVMKVAPFNTVKDKRLIS